MLAITITMIIIGLEQHFSHLTLNIKISLKTTQRQIVNERQKNILHIHCITQWQTQRLPSTPNKREDMQTPRKLFKLTKQS